MHISTIYHTSNYFPGFLHFFISMKTKDKKHIEAIIAENHLRYPKITSLNFQYTNWTSKNSFKENY